MKCILFQIITGKFRKIRHRISIFLHIGLIYFSWIILVRQHHPKSLSICFAWEWNLPENHITPQGARRPTSNNWKFATTIGRSAKMDYSQISYIQIARNGQNLFCSPSDRNYCSVTTLLQNLPGLSGLRWYAGDLA